LFDHGKINNVNIEFSTDEMGGSVDNHIILKRMLVVWGLI